MTESERNIWNFIEKYHPRYYTDERVAEANDLMKLLEKSFEEGDSAHRRLVKEYGCDTIDSMTELALLIRHTSLITKLYFEASQNALKIRQDNHFTVGKLYAKLGEPDMSKDDSTLIMIETTEPNGLPIGCFHCKMEIRDDKIVLIQQHDHENNPNNSLQVQ